jgi:hypothetical protein
VFSLIEKSVRLEIKKSGEKNLLYNPDYINFLQKNFTPYIFIWAGYVFRGMETQQNITRITQGSIEKYFGTIKRIRGQPIVPARHVIASMESVLSSCAILASSKLKDVKLMGNL